MKRLATWTVAVAAVASAGALRAHHSNSMFDGSTPIWVKGTVVRYEPVSPHAMIELEERRDDGQIQRRVIEGPFPGRLQRILSLNGATVEDFLKIGDSIEVCGFALKKEYSAQRLYPDTERWWGFVHGQVLVMPDGRMQSWGPYGKIDNCVRPHDQAQSWVDFLNRDVLARDLWCGPANVSVASITSQAFVDEINRLIAHPCN